MTVLTTAMPFDSLRGWEDQFWLPHCQLPLLQTVYKICGAVVSLLEVRQGSLMYSKSCREPVEVGQINFDYHRASWRPLDIEQSSFVCHKACWRPVHVSQAGFHYHKASWKPFEDCHASFDYCNVCWDLVNVQLLGFEYSIACRRTIRVQQARFDYRKGCWMPVEGCHMFWLPQNIACWRLVDVQ